MPISISKMAANTATVAVQTSDGTANVVYYPARVTEKVFAAMQAFSAADTSNILADFATFNQTLANLIQSWDVYEDDAQTQMFPIDASRFGELPLMFRMDIVGAIMTDIRPETAAPQTATTANS